MKHTPRKPMHLDESECDIAEAALRVVLAASAYVQLKDSVPYQTHTSAVLLRVVTGRGEIGGSGEVESLTDRHFARLTANKATKTTKTAVLGAAGVAATVPAAVSLSRDSSNGRRLSRAELISAIAGLSMAGKAVKDALLVLPTLSRHEQAAVRVEEIVGQFLPDEMQRVMAAQDFDALQNVRHAIGVFDEAIRVNPDGWARLLKHARFPGESARLGGLLGSEVRVIDVAYDVLDAAGARSITDLAHLAAALPQTPGLAQAMGS